MLTPLQQQALRAPRNIVLHSVAFQHGTQIPREFTGFGDDVSPPLAWSGTPSQAHALALVVDDPDAPGGTFTHWTAWNIPPKLQQLETGVKIAHLGGVEGSNDAGTDGYTGPMPPSGTHRYFFRIFALDHPLELRAGARVADVWRALGSHTLAWGELIGTCTKA